MRNLSDQTDLPNKLLTSLLKRGIRMRKIPKLGWLIRLVNHAIWTDYVYFLHLLLLSISEILASIPAYPMTSFIGMLG
jgi:hypothetical protein